MLVPIWSASFRAGTTTAIDGHSASVTDRQSSRSRQRQNPPRPRMRYNHAASAIATSTIPVKRQRASRLLRLTTRHRPSRLPEQCIRFAGTTTTTLAAKTNQHIERIGLGIVAEKL